MGGRSISNRRIVYVVILVLSASFLSGCSSNNQKRFKKGVKSVGSHIKKGAKSATKNAAKSETFGNFVGSLLWAVVKAPFQSSKKSKSESKPRPKPETKSVQDKAADHAKQRGIEQLKYEAWLEYKKQLVISGKPSDQKQFKKLSKHWAWQKELYNLQDPPGYVHPTFRLKAPSYEEMRAKLQPAYIVYRNNRPTRALGASNWKDKEELRRLDRHWATQKKKYDLKEPGELGKAVEEPGSSKEGSKASSEPEPANKSKSN